MPNIKYITDSSEELIKALDSFIDNGIKFIVGGKKRADLVTFMDYEKSSIDHFIYFYAGVNSGSYCKENM